MSTHSLRQSMRQAAKIAAFKHAGSMLPGASSGGNALVDSFPAPQSNVGEEMYNTYAPSALNTPALSDADIAAAGDGLPNPYAGVSGALKKFYEWGSTPIAAHTYAKEKGFSDLPYPEQAARYWKDHPPVASTAGAGDYGARLYDYFHNSQENGKYNSPEDATNRMLLSPARLVYNGFRGADWLANGTSDMANGQPAGPAATPKTDAAPATASVSAPAPAAGANTKGILGADNAMLHGLGGAGVGALLASALGDKKKRGRNALLGAGLGGGAGLLLNHLMNNKKAAMKEKQAEGGMPSDGIKNVAETIARAQGGLEGQVAGIGLGGLGGALLGAAHGAYSPGATASLDADGKPTLKRRSRLMGALRGGAVGGAGGALAGNFVGHHVGQYMGQQAAANAQKTANSFLDQLQLNNPLVQNAGIAGGLGGAALGGLAGLVSPGEEESVDEFGRPVRRQRGRFGAMLRGALGGGAAGALGGYAAGRFAPGVTGQALNAASSFGTDMAKRLGFGQQQPKPLNTANPQTLEEMMAADAQSRSKAPRSFRPLPSAGNYNTNMF